MDEETAEILNKNFQKLFTKEIDFDWGLENCTEVKLNYVKVEKEELIQLMKILGIRKTVGPDEISEQVLKM